MKHDTITIIFISISVIIILISFFMILYRNYKVYRFRMMIINIESPGMYKGATIKNLGNGKLQINIPIPSKIERYLLNKYSYNEMLYSTKPLNLLEWFSDEELKQHLTDEEYEKIKSLKRELKLKKIL